MADKSVQFDGCTQNSDNARPLGRQSSFQMLLFFKVINDVLVPRGKKTSENA